jgi:hypothetical protein
MVVSLGSQRDTEMLCAITASVQIDCDRTRGVEMLVSSEVQAVLLTNGEAAAAEFVGRGGTCQQASPAQRRYRFSQWPQRDGCERGIEVKGFSFSYKIGPLHWFFRHAPGCRDRETLDFREGETDLPLAPTVYCYRQGDEETDVSIAWCCVGALRVNERWYVGEQDRKWCRNAGAPNRPITHRKI